jgi:hypothetical protein
VTVQQHESGDLQDLIRVLGELVVYCESLDSHAQGAAQALTGQWKGMASSEFINQVGIWGAGSSTLRLGAQDLLAWATAAAQLYDDAQTQAKTMWSAG